MKIIIKEMKDVMKILKDKFEKESFTLAGVAQWIEC